MAWFELYKWKRRKYCVVVLASILQVQSGFNVCLKPYLNLCSQRWLKCNLSIVNIFIPIGSLILKIFLSTGLLNFSIASQKNIIIIRAANVWIKFIPFINEMWKKSFWSIQFCKEIHGKCCNICENFFIHLLCWRYSSPNSWYNLSWDQSSMASVIANVALYCNDSLIHLILHWPFCVGLNWKVGQPLDIVTVGKRFLTTLFREDAFCSNFIVNF